MRTENRHNLLAQLSSHKRDSERNSLLLTPPPQTPPAAAALAQVSRAHQVLRGTRQSQSSEEHLWIVPHTVESSTEKLSWLMGTLTSWELKRFHSQQTLKAVSVQRRESGQNNLVFPVPFLILQRV